MTQYRTRMYETYVSRFQEVSGAFDPQGALHWAAPYRTYFRGWLPAHLDAPILDVACGGGKFLFHLKMLGYTTLQGVDISAEQVALARQVVDDVVEENALELLARNRGALGLITALDFFEHLTKDEMLRFLELAFGALRPDGRLILQTPNGGSIWAGAIFSGDLTHEFCVNPSLLTKLLRTAGFVDVEAREMGPVIRGRGITSAIRVLVWRVIRAGMIIWNLAEAGNSERVLTRVFCISARRPPAAA
jgi:2-polyprenyl-3-methyl-5-hydroxy-6-metoxy-1,4-benzoquinol methylase